VKALDGIRLLDLTHMLSGPYAGMLLADLGADTIKVEPPGKGEATRRLLENDPKNSLNGMGAYFLTLNRNKRSVTIDLKSNEGLELFYALVEKSDVVLNNFSVGVPERLKIGHRQLAARNPRIITCSITGFGEIGPHKDWPSFDMIAQATGGGMSITGHYQGEPIRSGIPIGDLAGGLMGVIGILAALQSRHVTGRGQHIDISMQDAQISLLSYMATMYFLSKEVPSPLGNSHFVHVPYGSFQCRDGYIIVTVITDQFWKNLMNAVGLSELDSEENQHQPGRWKNRETINASLAARFRTNSQAYWLELLRKTRVPCAPVYTLAQVLTDAHVLVREMVVEVSHPLGGKTRQPGNPINMSAARERTYSPPPLLGADTESVLSQLLGKTTPELAKLRARGVI
jgi:crotonobetainyl-CoA:carnitine CoA-transferase CaiB-like acyl-CoA transferase